MVLTAIPTAIRGRHGVFAGVHCRTDSLRVRISGHRPTAADASPVTYKQGVGSSSLPAPTGGTPSERQVMHFAYPAELAECSHAIVTTGTPPPAAQQPHAAAP